MDSKRIEELLNKYWEGETSLEEEQLLRQYFTNANVPEQFREASLLFRYFNEQKKKSLADDVFPGVIQEARKVGKRTWLYNAVRIAAGVLVLVTATWFVRQEIRKSTPQEIVDTYDDPQLAFEETKKALMMISRGFGTAEEHAKKINIFNEAQEQIESNSKEKPIEN